MISPVTRYSISPTSIAGLSTQDAKTQKLDYALATSALNKSFSLNLLGAIPEQSNNGLTSALMYQIYDSKALTVSVLEAYKKRLDASESLEEEKNQDSSETTDASEGAAADTETAESATPTPAYMPGIEAGRGYNAEAVRKYYDEMAAWYADPKNAGKNYAPATSGNAVDITA